MHLTSENFLSSLGFVDDLLYIKSFHKSMDKIILPFVRAHTHYTTTTHTHTHYTHKLTLLETRQDQHRGHTLLAPSYWPTKRGGVPI